MTGCEKNIDIKLASSSCIYGKWPAVSPDGVTVRVLKPIEWGDLNADA